MLKLNCVVAVVTASSVLAAMSALAAPTSTSGKRSTPMQGGVTVQKVAYFNQPNCLKLSNGTVEVIVTTDIGPRIIRYGLVGGDNALAELPDKTVPTELGTWRPYGGHRMWSAPEGMPRSYSPDNDPVAYKIEGTDTVVLTETVEPKTGIEKQMVVKLAATGPEVSITMRLTNRNMWNVQLAVWGLTIMHGGGVTILPQEPYRSHDDYLLPARPVVLWHYTDLSDPRYTLGKKYIRLKTVTSLADPQKIGIANKQGWAGYWRENTLFVKRFNYHADRMYPDDGCNNEAYTAADFMELETLGYMHDLAPGEFAEHTERWYLFKNVNVGHTEATMDAAITPLIAQTVPR